jgi:hypothetical protein
MILAAADFLRMLPAFLTVRIPRAASPATRLRGITNALRENSAMDEHARKTASPTALFTVLTALL